MHNINWVTALRYLLLYPTESSLHPIPEPGSSFRIKDGKLQQSLGKDLWVDAEYHSFGTLRRMDWSTVHVDYKLKVDNEDAFHNYAVVLQALNNIRGDQLLEAELRGIINRIHHEQLSETQKKELVEDVQPIVEPEPAYIDVKWPEALEFMQQHPGALVIGTLVDGARVSFWCCIPSESTSVTRITTSRGEEYRSDTASWGHLTHFMWQIPKPAPERTFVSPRPQELDTTPVSWEEDGHKYTLRLVEHYPPNLSASSYFTKREAIPDDIGRWLHESDCEQYDYAVAAFEKYAAWSTSNVLHQLGLEKRSASTPHDGPQPFLYALQEMMRVPLSVWECNQCSYRWNDALSILEVFTRRNTPEWLECCAYVSVLLANPWTRQQPKAAPGLNLVKTDTGTEVYRDGKQFFLISNNDLADLEAAIALIKQAKDFS